MIDAIIEFIIALLLAIFVGLPPVEVAPAYIECGCCGAHVTEWWYVRNASDTAFVEVCHDCYETVRSDL